MDKFTFLIQEELCDERIDKCLSLLMDTLSRSYIQKLIKEDNVLVNNKVVKANYRVKADDEVSFYLPKSIEPEILPQDIPLDVLYEAEDVIIINKPKGMVVHPAAGHYKDTLVKPTGATYTFCVTGSVTQWSNRDELKKQLESLGHKVVGGVSSKTDYLINNDIESTTGKNKKAKELGKPIINEDQLKELLGI